MFYRKPGKVGATTQNVWIGILMRRGQVNAETAKREVASMIEDGRLIQSDA